MGFFRRLRFYLRLLGLACRSSLATLVAECTLAVPVGNRTGEASAGCTCVVGIAGRTAVRVSSTQTGLQRDTSKFGVKH